MSLKRISKSLGRPFLRMWRRMSRKKRARISVIAVVSVMAFGLGVYYQSMTPKSIDPAAYTPLLNTIAKGESNGNYNAYFGHADNTSVRFTDMTIAEVLKWQEDYVKQGSPSSAVGKYQIIRPTLQGLVKQLDMPPDTRFNEATQDQMAIALLERRGARAYLSKEMTREQFAANLAKEWAALPRVVGENPEESYYAHDGLNKSQIGISEIFDALATLENKASVL